MKKKQANRLANKLMIAAMLFTQAVFLLAPFNLSLAQGTLAVNWSTFPPTNATGTVRLTVYSNYTDANVHFLVEGPQYQTFSASIHDSTSYQYAADWNTSGLPAGYYLIRAEANRAGEFATSSIASVAIAVNVSDTIIPTAPTNLVATALANNYVTLNWQASSDNVAVVNYNVYRGQSAGWIQIGQPNINFYTDYSVTPSAPYYYKVTAVDAAGNQSGDSNNIFLNVPAGAAPISPANLQATQTDLSISLSWTNSTGATHYAVQRSTNGSSYVSLTTNTTENYYTDTAITVGSNYAYRVYACDTSNGCSATASISNTVLVSPPAVVSTSTIVVLAPSNLTAQASGSVVTLNWTDNSNNESGFKIYRYQNSLWTDIGNVGSNITTKIEPSVAAGTYKYKVQAFVNSGTYPAYSATSNETPLITVDQTMTLTTTIIKQPATINLIQPADGAIVSSWVKLLASSYGPIRSVEILKTSGGLLSSLGNAHLNSSGYQWELGWDTATAVNGDYLLEAVAWDEQNFKINSNKITVKVANNPNTNLAKPLTTAENTAVISPTPTPPANEPANAALATATDPLNTTAINQPIPQSDNKNLPPLAPQNINEILQTTAHAVDSRCQEIGINDQLKCTNYLYENMTLGSKDTNSEKSALAECKNADIQGTRDCQLFMRTQYLVLECKKEGITTKAECRKYMESRFGRLAICNGSPASACQKLINEVILADFVDQKIIDQANGEAKEINGKYLEIIQSATSSEASRTTVREDTLTLPAINPEFNSQNIKTIDKVLPFAKSEKQLNLLILSSTADTEKSKILVNFNALIDSDADGLPDDIETRLGTDKMNADSDGDGFADGVEMRTGHNPLGTGELTTKLKPIELAILNKVNLEQPKLSGETRADILKIQRITNNQAASSTAGVKLTDELKLQGRALPNEVVSLYIYSVMPIVLTVKADENGNWNYNLDKSLTDGKHEAYVVINDEAGKVKAKSAPFSFFIKEAKAVSQNDFLGTDFSVPDRTTELTGWYISGSLLLVVIALGGYLLYRKTKEKSVTYSN